MAAPVIFTSQPIRIDSDPGTLLGVTQKIWTVPEVLAYDQLDIEFTLVALESPGGAPLLTVGIMSGLQKDSFDDWAGTDTSAVQLSSIGEAKKISCVGDFLRYAGWVVAGGNPWWGTQASATFFISAMGRVRSIG